MRHHKIQKYLLLHSEGLLDDALQNDMDAHLAICSECQRLARRLELVYGSPLSNEAIKAPAGLFTRITALMGERRGIAPAAGTIRQPQALRPVARSMTVLRPLLAATIVLMAIGMGVFLGSIPVDNVQAADPGVQLKQIFYTDMLEVSSPHSYYQAVEHLYAQPFGEE